jgi:hypothetical protein
MEALPHMEVPSLKNAADAALTQLCVLRSEENAGAGFDVLQSLVKQMVITTGSTDDDELKMIIQHLYQAAGVSWGRKSATRPSLIIRAARALAARESGGAIAGAHGATAEEEAEEEASSQDSAFAVQNDVLPPGWMKVATPTGHMFMNAILGICQPTPPVLATATDHGGAKAGLGVAKLHPKLTNPPTTANIGKTGPDCAICKGPCGDPPGHLGTPRAGAGAYQQRLGSGDPNLAGSALPGGRGLKRQLTQARNGGGGPPACAQCKGPCWYPMEHFQRVPPLGALPSAMAPCGGAVPGGSAGPGPGTGAGGGSPLTFRQLVKDPATGGPATINTFLGLARGCGLYGPNTGLSLVKHPISMLNIGVCLRRPSGGGSVTFYETAGGKIMINANNAPKREINDLMAPWAEPFSGPTTKRRRRGGPQLSQQQLQSEGILTLDADLDGVGYGGPMAGECEVEHLHRQFFPDPATLAGPGMSHPTLHQMTMASAGAVGLVPTGAGQVAMMSGMPMVGALGQAGAGGVMAAAPILGDVDAYYAHHVPMQPMSPGSTAADGSTTGSMGFSMMMGGVLGMGGGGPGVGGAVLPGMPPMGDESTLVAAEMWNGLWNQHGQAQKWSIG